MNVSVSVCLRHLKTKSWGEKKYTRALWNTSPKGVFFEWVAMKLFVILSVVLLFCFV